MEIKVFDNKMFDDKERCDECGYEDNLFNAVLGSKSVRLCNRCIANNNALVIPMPKNVEIIVKRRTVDEVMRDVSGIKPNKFRQSSVLRKQIDAGRVSISQQISPDVFKPKYREARDKQLVTLAELRKLQEQKAQKIEEAVYPTAEQLLEEIPAETEEQPKKSAIKDFFKKINIFKRQNSDEQKADGQPSEDLNAATQIS